ncbi:MULTISPECIES: ABC transporter substrate-binding protein [Streptomyces]|uniref:Extracellular solute-binding protein n=1 Tax=Streptomyces cinereoruber TaxID=67260 RepID=A0ABX6BPY3_9ACTN|nr:MULTISPECIES: extracellular solute-binding protein [Streptomyces]AVH94070.1 sugar-binding protein [Streptomyces sp. WAC00288]KYG51507.1 sugar-binding protein [Streptomyces sp. WAC04657]MBB4161175.1 cellobiose transport system substrate-binding protein [Streptomyces cinereoruber]MBY8819709.1 extracellular solute-binding protein [Streptomyces cinereoruber]NIH63553.1 cellobiose transport system substrate-binding protein [Streptomyces cinereoruber]
MPIARAAKRAVVRLGAVTLAGALLAACGGSSDDSSSDSAGGKVTITVDLFGSFGYKEAGLYAEYEKLHPGVTIKQTDTEDEADYWKSLQTRLAGGAGLADVQGIEVGRIASVTQQQADRFEDLKKYGADSLKDQFAPAKWAAATGKGGEVLGLGTDVGPEAMCYRTDLFQQAGLPTDREELAKKWSTWDGYLDLGKQYKAKAPAKSAWLDSVGSLYSIMIGQEKERYYDASGKLIWEQNPALRSAWDHAVQAADAGLSAKLDQWSPQWNQAFSAGSFATIPCPAWMLGYIKGQAGEAGKGKWDVAKLPGGAGNWGGSYLAVPKAAKHKKEAYELIKWLTAPEQQTKLFQKQGNFPSATGAIEKVADAKDPFFSDAPIGKIFGDAAKEAPVQVLGVHDQNIAQQITNALSEVERKGTAPEKAWSNAKKGVENTIG